MFTKKLTFLSSALLFVTLFACKSQLVDSVGGSDLASITIGGLSIDKFPWNEEMKSKTPEEKRTRLNELKFAYTLTINAVSSEGEPSADCKAKNVNNTAQISGDKVEIPSATLRRKCSYEIDLTIHGEKVKTATQGSQSAEKILLLKGMSETKFKLLVPETGNVDTVKLTLCGVQGNPVFRETCVSTEESKKVETDVSIDAQFQE